MSQAINNTQTEHDTDEVMTVDLVKLRSLVQAKITEDKYSDFRLIINSIIDRQEYTRYHYQEYRHIIDSKNNVQKQFSLVLSEKEYRDKVAIKANILACIQNLYTIHDMLAHLITYALDIKFEKERNITLKNVHSRLKKNANYADIDNLLDDLIGNDNFRYVVSNVNHSKHKYNIEPSIHIAPMEEPPVKCIFSEFSFHGEDYPAIDIDDFFNTEFCRELRLILKIENKLIEILDTGKKTT
jgi:hypothetical protein